MLKHSQTKLLIGLSLMLTLLAQPFRLQARQGRAEFYAWTLAKKLDSIMPLKTLNLNQITTANRLKENRALVRASYFKNIEKSKAREAVYSEKFFKVKVKEVYMGIIRVLKDVSCPDPMRSKRKDYRRSDFPQIGLGPVSPWSKCLHSEPADINTLCKRDEGFYRPPGRSGRHAKSVLPNWEADNLVESELGKKRAE